MASLFKARAPGKIILSGEHAVVYGAPALVMAVNQYVEVEVEPIDTPSLAIFFNGQTSIILNFEEVKKLKDEMDGAYAAYLEGHELVENIVKNPTHLIAYAVTLVTDNIEMKQGLQIDIRLGIPLGSGMGSSAAVILATLKSAAACMGKKISNDELYRLACRTENLQHGRSSGVDPYACLHGGLIRFEAEKQEKLHASLPEFYLVNTGKPQSSTGECVSHVRQEFEDSAIWAQFEAATDYIQQAILHQDTSNIKVGLAKNQSLLSAIGVVPAKVDHFISSIMNLGGAAKICGAGSLTGDEGGMVLVLSSAPPTELCDRFGYSFSELEIDGRGLCDA